MKLRRERTQRPSGPKSRPASGPRRNDQRRGPGRRIERGPNVCPMCGEIVTNLSGHMRSKHDDAESHPRD